MAFPTRIELRGVPTIARKIRRLEKSAFSYLMMREIGVFAISEIKQRTILGEDASGISFKPYSKAYAKWREKKGYKSRPVDLSLTGSLLSAMTFTSDKDTTNIFFLNTSDPTGSRNPEKAFFLNQDREFFALSSKDVRGIVKIFNRYYKKVLES